MATKMTRQIVSVAPEYIKILRRPKRSIVKIRGTEPAAKRVFIRAERSWAMKGERPTWEKMTVL